MPRVSLRRGIFYLIAATTCSFLLISVHQPTNSWPPSTAPRAAQSPSRMPLENSGLIPFTSGRDAQIELHGISLKDSDMAPSGGGGEGEGTDTVNHLEELLKLPPLDSVVPLPPLTNNFTKPPNEQLAWYIKDGLLRPTIPPDPDQYKRKQKLWPNEVDDDRIVDQLMFRPPLPPPEEEIPDVVSEKAPLPFKKILMYNGMQTWQMKAGRGTFMKMKCPIDTCVVTGNRAEAASADAILFKDHFNPPHHQRPYSQVWIMYMLECPLHTQQFSIKNAFNWTATYKHDSDIVTPYEKYVYYDKDVRQKAQDINYAANKTNQVAWFVSNCGARNNRLNYARELGKYIQVDIYGACGSHRCPRSNAVKCFDMLNRQYKFYLAFENSNCRDYITEKFFVNGLRGRPGQKSHHILPIVMGAHPDDYKRVAPERSYIHVDDFESPKHLAQYLHLLDKNDDLYNEYFRWKGTGEFINTFFVCRLCALLHDEEHVQHYEDINQWWRAPGSCINGSWRNKLENKSKNQSSEKSEKPKEIAKKI